MSEPRGEGRPGDEEPGRGWRGSFSGRNARREEEPPPVIRDKRKFDAEGNLRVPTDDALDEASRGASGAGAGNGSGEPLSQGDVDVALAVLDLKTQLDERTADLQRLSAEYANYRKRVDRDRVAIGEIATARILEGMLPVLDDIERAAAHGDLSGPFKAVADKLVVALTGFGLVPFGTPGDQFDPVIHEAVMHEENDTVDVPTATTVMRQGYRLGDRLLRPAMVGVTDPIQPAQEPVDSERAADGPSDE